MRRRRAPMAVDLAGMRPPTADSPREAVRLRPWMAPAALAGLVALWLLGRVLHLA